MTPAGIETATFRPYLIQILLLQPQYAAITLTTSVPMHTVEQDF